MKKYTIEDRIHWAPPYLPDKVITNLLSKYGKVHAINFETSTSKGFKGVRYVVMSGGKHEIPHMIPLMYEGDMSACHDCGQTATLSAMPARRAFLSRLFDALLPTLCTV